MIAKMKMTNDKDDDDDDDDGDNDDVGEWRQTVLVTSSLCDEVTTAQ